MPEHHDNLGFKDKVHKKNTGGIMDKKRTSLQLEIDEINRLKRKHNEVRPMSTQLISKLKSAKEGRGVVPEAELDRLRKAFKAMVDSLEEDDGE